MMCSLLVVATPGRLKALPNLGQPLADTCTPLVLKTVKKLTCSRSVKSKYVRFKARPPGLDMLPIERNIVRISVSVYVASHTAHGTKLTQRERVSSSTLYALPTNPEKHR